MYYLLYLFDVLFILSEAEEGKEGSSDWGPGGSGCCGSGLQLCCVGTSGASHLLLQSDASLGFSSGQISLHLSFILEWRYMLSITGITSLWQ